MATWIERAKTKFSITMGDGQVYMPLSMNANKSDEFNVSEFNFRNLDGTLVDKRRRMGTTYDLTMIFQGGDHLDVARAFQKSSWNSKPWTIQHPYYDKLGVQPVTAVSYDNSNQVQGVTIIKVTVRETITKPIINTANPADTITTGQQSTAQHYAQYFVNAVPVPKVSDVSQMQSDVSNVQTVLLKAGAGVTSIINGYNKAQGAINSAISDVSGAINAIVDYITLPALLADSVANRISNLNSMFGLWQVQIDNAIATDFKHLNKFLWYAEAGTVLSAMCLASVSNVTSADYQYSSQVNNVITTIIKAYNNFLASLDSMQTATGNELGSWVADTDTIILLDNLIYLTLATLFAYQANSKQARYVTLTRDSNVYLIAWQLYGLLDDDSTIDRVIADNNIGGNWLLQVPKGTQVLYYA